MEEPTSLPVTTKEFVAGSTDIRKIFYSKIKACPILTLAPPPLARNGRRCEIISNVEESYSGKSDAFES